MRSDFRFQSKSPSLSSRVALRLPVRAPERFRSMHHSDGATRTIRGWTHEPMAPGRHPRADEREMSLNVSVESEEPDRTPLSAESSKTSEMHTKRPPKPGRCRHRR